MSKRARQRPAAPRHASPAPAAAPRGPGQYVCGSCGFTLPYAGPVAAAPYCVVCAAPAGKRVEMTWEEK